MRAALLPRCTVASVVAVVSVPRLLGGPAAQPAAAAVGARLGMGEDIIQKLIVEIKGCSSWLRQFGFAKSKFLAAPEILHITFRLFSFLGETYGLFTVCGHPDRAWIWDKIEFNFNMAKGL